MFAEECLWAKSQHLLWRIISYFAEKVNTLFAFRGEISLKKCNAPCRGRLIVDPPACGTERLDEWYSFPTRTVGADSIRPRHEAPRKGRFVPGRHARRPLRGRVLSTGCFLKSGVSGGCYPPLQRLYCSTVCFTESGILPYSYTIILHGILKGF